MAGKKIIRAVHRKNRLRVGYECEVFVGQGLVSLSREGFQIFHDFPANDRFNIDHIAIGPLGVFAVETKGRSKPAKAENENWKVRYDGKALIFPNKNPETAPIDQAKRQAKWLKNWIAEAAGENIEVTPVLAIPGWYIEQTSSGITDVQVIYGKHYILKPNSKKTLSSDQITRIAFQIEQKCRTVQVKNYQK